MAYMQLSSLKIKTNQVLRNVVPKGVTRSRSNVQVKAEFFGSQENLLVCGCTALFLVAGRFGVAPTANKLASAGLNLEDYKSGLISGDPSGFTAVDVLYLGTAGHAVAIGIVLGLKGIGAI
eukprot:TRINITY_DN393_c0_g1_i2.p4 TRINITY_DN393_c0_g1~~TRINITY_DN393_c0_g1_i2.p4  ORF type:complete len:121 (+),score=14.62 TRINITY_DN393_c0_g1_i2:102-464(+)